LKEKITFISNRTYRINRISADDFCINKTFARNEFKTFAGQFGSEFADKAAEVKDSIFDHGHI